LAVYQIDQSLASIRSQVSAKKQSSSWSSSSTNPLCFNENCRSFYVEVSGRVLSPHGPRLCESFLTKVMGSKLMNQPDGS
jgi:hypothetical protein